jgi:hypothetical protein
VYDYNLEHLFSYTVTLDQPEVIGPVSEGIRVNLYITGGEVNGPQVHGKVRPLGADWLTIRTDGVGILDVRAAIETQEEALIYSSYTGVETSEKTATISSSGENRPPRPAARGPAFSDCPP